MASRGLRRRAAALTVWAGVTGDPEPLRGRVAVLSPHLDDGVLSLGAAIAHAARRRAEVTMITVLAGDPESSLPAGSWDRRSGFATAGEAFGARRAEDARACELVGARPVWLPFFDSEYQRGGDEEIWPRLEGALGDAESVLVPGFPLQHEDHRWLRELVDRRGVGGRRLGEYVEQPYAGLWLPPASADQGLEWPRVAASVRDRFAKARASRAYASQLPLFGKRPVLRMTRSEAMRGGEAVRWLE
jgi:LmbE family N-acetylglucosaminyl deacetylase